MPARASIAFWSGSRPVKRLKRFSKKCWNVSAVLPVAETFQPFYRTARESSTSSGDGAATSKSTGQPCMIASQKPDCWLCSQSAALLASLHRIGCIINEVSPQSGKKWGDAVGYTETWALQPSRSFHLPMLFDLDTCGQRLQKTMLLVWYDYWRHILYRQHDISPTVSRFERPWFLAHRRIEVFDRRRTTNYNATPTKRPSKKLLMMIRFCWTGLMVRMNKSEERKNFVERGLLHGRPNKPSCLPFLSYEKDTTLFPTTRPKGLSTTGQMLHIILIEVSWVEGMS